MSGAFNQKRARRSPSINIAPLIDVMFLLLIFFMVSSTFRDKLGIDLDLPQANSAAAQVEESPTITVNATSEISFNGAKYENVDTLRVSLEKLFESEGDTRIVLRADETADFGIAIRVLDIAREIGFTQIVVPTKPVVPPPEE